MLHRHDISDEIWNKINVNLPGSVGHTGCNGVDNRCFINAVFWILRTGAPWRDLPKEYGDWKNTHRRFARWRDRGIWGNILKSVKVYGDLNARKWCKRRKSRHGGLKRAVNKKVHVVVDARVMPLKIL